MKSAVFKFFNGLCKPENCISLIGENSYQVLYLQITLRMRQTTKYYQTFLRKLNEMVEDDEMIFENDKMYYLCKHFFGKRTNNFIIENLIWAGMGEIAFEVFEKRNRQLGNFLLVFFLGDIVIFLCSFSSSLWIESKISG
jgi:phage-related protein